QARPAAPASVRSPYTTLFRSPPEPRDHPNLGLLHDREGAAAREHGALAPRGDLGLGARPRPQEDVQEQGQRPHADAPARRVWSGDRKSTRLNSSHEWNSYAVF